MFFHEHAKYEFNNKNWSMCYIPAFLYESLFYNISKNNSAEISLSSSATDLKYNYLALLQY